MPEVKVQQMSTTYYETAKALNYGASDKNRH